MASSSGSVAYNPSDTLQTQFLSALALGETGNQSNAWTEGVGGVNVSGLPTDQYGFPTWSGNGSSHAAGAFQFQPGTWDQIASQYGLNFANPSDQQAGAWYYAQQQYAQVTGGQSLEAALQSGQYQSVQQALAAVWPSVTGNAAAPQGLAMDLQNGVGANLGGSGAGTSATGAGGSTASGGGSTGIVGTVEQFFVRFGLIILGALVILVALWQLLSDRGVVPSPGDVAKGVAGAVAA